MAPTTKKHNPFVRFISRPFKYLFKRISPIDYVKLEYRYNTGHKLNLNNPVRYTEKLQYLRLYQYPNDERVIECASRSGLREYAKKLGLESNLVDIYGIFDSFKDIDFSTLPNRFIMKCTHACGFNYICYDKKNINLKKLGKLFNKWLKIDYGKSTVERHYSSIKPQIIIEELLLEDNHLPIEYKIHVFNGKAKYLYVVTDRYKKIHYNNYYIDWTPFNEAQFNHWTETNRTLKKPDNFNDAIKIAELLAAPFPFVRVDLYIINKVYISEMTFTPAKGTLTFRDDQVDYQIGEWLDIKK